MRIGLLVLSVGNFGKIGFYNLQEVGLARELDSLFDEVIVYRLVDKRSEPISEPIRECKNAALHLLPSKRIGTNGIPDLKKLDPSIDVLVCFSDTQVFFPMVYRWCQKNGIKLIPYIGVSKSHSENHIKQRLIDLLFVKDLALYKKLTCLAKNPDVRDDLLNSGVKNVITTPVGLDMERLKTDYEATPVNELKHKFGYSPDEKIILFIGRMTAEKQPYRMIEIFKSVLRIDPSFRLIMVGSGELSDTVQKLIDKNGLNELVKRLEGVPNKDIWELYRIANCFVNLNQHEIYGMVLLEAMFYGCKVIAWSAPGPDYIIKHGETGYIAHSDEEVCNLILEGKSLAERSKAAILSDFTWKKTAAVINDLSREDASRL